MDIFNTVVLSLSGLLLLFVGATRVMRPIQNYEKNSGIKIENDVDLLNEVRGTSALMLLAAATVLSGAVVAPLTTSSFVVATVVFLGFGLGRSLSIGLDGMPNKLLIRGLASELVLGALNAFGLFMRLT